MVLAKSLRLYSLHVLDHSSKDCNGCSIFLSFPNLERLSVWGEILPNFWDLTFSCITCTTTLGKDLKRIFTCIWKDKLGFLVIYLDLRYTLTNLGFLVSNWISKTYLPQFGCACLCPWYIYNRAEFWNRHFGVTFIPEGFNPLQFKRLDGVSVGMIAVNVLLLWWWCKIAMQDMWQSSIVVN